jgi:hypothetical protein
MSRFANDVRFTQTWYTNPPYPTTVAEAEKWPQFAQRAAWLHSQYPTGRLAIAGTGLAWTQYFLFTNHSRQSWGCDINWSVTRAKGILGAWANNVMEADVTNATQMTSFRRLGNTGQQRYDVLFTEDLLPCANDDAEAQLMLTRLRAVGTTLVHMVSVADPDTTQTPDMLWKTPEQWRALIGTERIVLPDLTEVP